MDTIKDKVEELVKAILGSPDYVSLQKAQQQVNSIPGLADKIREFSWKNYELQNSDADDFCEQMEEFAEQYQEFCKEPAVSQYLEQEVRMCRVLQEINARILDSVELVL